MQNRSPNLWLTALVPLLLLVVPASGAGECAPRCRKTYTDIVIAIDGSSSLAYPDYRTMVYKAHSFVETFGVSSSQFEPQFGLIRFGENRRGQTGQTDVYRAESHTFAHQDMDSRSDHRQTVLALSKAICVPSAQSGESVCIDEELNTPCEGRGVNVCVGDNACCEIRLGTFWRWPVGDASTTGHIAALVAVDANDPGSDINEFITEAICQPAYSDGGTVNIINDCKGVSYSGTPTDEAFDSTHKQFTQFGRLNSYKLMMLYTDGIPTTCFLGPDDGAVRFTRGECSGAAGWGTSAQQSTCTGGPSGACVGTFVAKRYSNAMKDDPSMKVNIMTIGLGGSFGEPQRLRLEEFTSEPLSFYSVASGFNELDLLRALKYIPCFYVDSATSMGETCAAMGSPVTVKGYGLRILGESQCRFNLRGTTDYYYTNATQPDDAIYGFECIIPEVFLQEDIVVVEVTRDGTQFSIDKSTIRISSDCSLAPPLPEAPGVDPEWCGEITCPDDPPACPAPEVARKIDLVFAIDGSCSITHGDFNAMKDMIRFIAQSSENTDGNINFGLVRFGLPDQLAEENSLTPQARVIHPLQSGSEALVAALDDGNMTLVTIPDDNYIIDGAEPTQEVDPARTPLDEGLEAAGGVFAAGRTDAIKVVLMLSDMESTSCTTEEQQLHKAPPGDLVCDYGLEYTGPTGGGITQLNCLDAVNEVLGVNVVPLTELTIVQTQPLCYGPPKGCSVLTAPTNIGWAAYWSDFDNRQCNLPGAYELTCANPSRTACEGFATEFVRGGTVFNTTTIVGVTDSKADLDAECCKMCAQEPMCEFWKRSASPVAPHDCLLMNNEVFEANRVLNAGDNAEVSGDKNGRECPKSAFSVVCPSLKLPAEISGSCAEEGKGLYEFSADGTVLCVPFMSKGDGLACTSANNEVNAMRGRDSALIQAIKLRRQGAIVGIVGYGMSSEKSWRQSTAADLVSSPELLFDPTADGFTETIQRILGVWKALPCPQVRSIVGLTGVTNRCVASRSQLQISTLNMVALGPSIVCRFEGDGQYRYTFGGPVPFQEGKRVLCEVPFFPEDIPVTLTVSRGDTDETGAPIFYGDLEAITVSDSCTLINAEHTPVPTPAPEEPAECRAINPVVGVNDTTCYPLCGDRSSTHEGCNLGDMLRPGDVVVDDQCCALQRGHPNCNYCGPPFTGCLIKPANCTQEPCDYTECDTGLGMETCESDHELNVWCAGDVDCELSFSPCTAECTREVTVIADRTGMGADCPPIQTCSLGMDACTGSNCAGSWVCGPECIAAWVETTSQSGAGVACPVVAPSCGVGDGQCAGMDCQGSWGTCSATCTRVWQETQSQTGAGAECPEMTPCNPEDDLCPALCGTDYHVDNGVCKKCEKGSRKAGDSTLGENTKCTVANSVSAMYPAVWTVVLCVMRLMMA